MTAPYNLPIATFTGRYLDSQYSRDIQFNFRTARAYNVKLAPDRGRIYMILGSALAAYDIKTFFTRLEAGEPLMPENEVPVAYNTNHTPPERFLRWGQWFYAEGPGGWQIPLADGQDRLFGFDWDDRGYIYLAYSVYGWGVAFDGGGNQAGIMTSAFQEPTAGDDVSPTNILSFKTSDGSYYALVSADNSQNSNLWYMGTSAQLAHERRGFPKISTYKFSKNASGTRIGVVDLDGSVKIYSSDSLLNNSPLTRFPPRAGTYTGIDTDGTNFYAISTASSGATISVLAPSGGGYTNIGDYPVGVAYYGGYPDIHYGAGYLTVFGPEAGASGNVRLFKLAGTVPTDVPLGNYFADYYTGIGSTHGFAFPPQTSTFHDAMVYKSGTKYYLIIAATGFGDVYEIKGNDSIIARVKSTFETPNPNAGSVANPGPIYGDKITFSSGSTSSVPPAVNWSFGDNTAGSALPGADISHQYAGVAGVASVDRQVVATSTLDPNITDSLKVTIKAPVVRFGIKGRPELLFLQPDASSAAPIVTSDEFIDSSDGAVESHFNEWRLDAATMRAMPSASLAAGACGAHTLNYAAHYGPYDAAFNPTSSDVVYPIGSFVYASAPFAFQVGQPTSGADNVTFPATGRVSSVAADLPGGASTAAQYTWDLLDANGTSLATASGASTLGAVPSFIVPRSRFGSAALKARLVVTVSASALGAGCQAFTATSSSLGSLIGPSATLSNNCGPTPTVGAPCTFSVVSSASQPSWNYNWTVIGSSAVNGLSGTGSQFATFNPSIVVPGSYTVNVTVSNALGSLALTNSITLAQSACPSSSDNSIQWAGVTSSCYGSYTACSANETINFHVYPVHDCDTFSWSFGDGGASTVARPSHSFAANGTYTVTVHIANGGSPKDLTASILVGNGAPPPPPPPPPPPTGGNGGGGSPCGTLSTSSAYIGYNGATSSCTSSNGNCNPGEQLNFHAYSQNGYNFGCADHTFTWNFGDGSTATGQIPPAHVYAAANSYNASVTIFNGYQQTTVTQVVKVGTVITPGPTVCPALSLTNVALAYGAQSAACKPGGTCASSEAVNFSVQSAGYPLTCGNHSFQWQTSDQFTSASPSPQHAFATAGDYTVTVTVSNPIGSSVTLSQPVHVANFSGSCPPMTTGNAYVGYNGPVSGCTSSNGDCNSDEELSFRAYSQNGYTFSCGSHTYDWDFGDKTTHGSGQLTTHKYSGAGTYDSILTITNSSGSIQIKQKVSVTGGGGAKGATPPRRRAGRH